MHIFLSLSLSLFALLIVSGIEPELQAAPVPPCNCNLVEKAPAEDECSLVVSVDFDYVPYATEGECEFGWAPCPVVFHCWYKGVITVTTGAFTDIKAAGGGWQGQDYSFEFDLTQCGHFNYEWIEVWDNLHIGRQCEFEVGVTCNSCHVNQ